MQLVVGLMLGATALTVLLYGEELPVAFWGSAWLTLIEMWLVVAVALLFSTVGVPVLAAAYSAGLILAGNLSQDILNLSERIQEQGDSLSSAILYSVYRIIPDLSDLSLRQRPPIAWISHLDLLFMEASTVSRTESSLLGAMWVLPGNMSDFFALTLVAVFVLSVSPLPDPDSPSAIEFEYWITPTVRSAKEPTPYLGR